MKTTMKTTVMLIAMTFGTLAASAQSARRGTQNEDQRRATTSTAMKKSRNQSSTSETLKQTTTTRTVTKNNTYAQARNTNQGTRTYTRTQEPHKSNGQSYSKHNKVSTTNSHNSRSTYNTPNRTVHVNKTHVDPRAKTKYVEPRKNHSTNVVNENGRKNGHHQHNKYYDGHKNNKYYNNKYTHKHHKNYYYPNKRVKIHYHPMTYNNHYRVSYYPAHREIIWTNRMHRYYVGLYPRYNTWHYPLGYRIQTISAFDTRYNVGEISRVYGRVYATWFNHETDDLLLFFGGEFPNQAFTMVIPGHIARRYSWRPERYFLGQHVFATGLIGQFDGQPEMIIKKKDQLEIY